MLAGIFEMVPQGLATGLAGRRKASNIWIGTSIAR